MARVRGKRDDNLTSMFMTLAICFVGAGLFFVVASMTAVFAADRAERLTALTATVLADSVPGRKVLVEGHISERNSVLFRRYVAHYTYEYQGKDDEGHEQWPLVGTVTPPLLVELPDGRVQVAGGYKIEGDRVISFQEGPRVIGTNRYEGFVAGNPVMVIGTIVRGGVGVVIRAEFIWGGNKQTYLDFQHGESSSRREFGLVSILIGMLSATLAGYRRGLLRVLRERWRHRE